ncbi:sn-1-specific diacylglycerol lipase ABHD11-like [Lineus longissimus]|uniref:sn-1-specific diacylglycerol lipase ABHD11-like n=1 Tax=Lineus longissimus TaxID=88925 RepID=UPI002B4D49E9
MTCLASRRFFSILTHFQPKFDPGFVVKNDNIVQRFYCHTAIPSLAPNEDEIVTLSHNVYESHKKSQKVPLVLIHGLLGSGKNWGMFAKSFREQRTVMTVDVRCHGSSPTVPKMDYHLMSQDIKALMDHYKWKKACILGHSMGGKIAMVLALTQPNLVDHLIVADSNPGMSTGGQQMFAIIDALAKVRFNHSGALPAARRDAADQLLSVVKEASVRHYLVMNVQKTNGKYCFRTDPHVIGSNLDTILGFPHFSEEKAFLGKTLFLGGANSRYISEDTMGDIERLFPTAGVQHIPNAGHWVHSDQPAEFTRRVKQFLGDL